MSQKKNKKTNNAYKFSVAPMLDCTDKHFRVLMRHITNRALLYTEMIVAQALHHTQRREKLLDFYKIEHPLAIQLGGSNPNLLREAAKIAEDWGYDEINLNIGCPSSKVISGNFGAYLMAKPDQVARCVEAMVSASNLPVTIKTRLGIDNLDSNENLISFIDTVSKAGAEKFTIHARKAWLKGLDPKQNRTIPPLQPERVFDLKKKRPNLIIELNGGINSILDCQAALENCDGVMVGRAAYEYPLRWEKVDELFFGEQTKKIKASYVIKKMIPHTENHLQNGGRVWDIGRHLMHLVKDVPGARIWRNQLGRKAQEKSADLRVLEEAAHQLLDRGL